MAETPQDPKVAREQQRKAELDRNAREAQELLARMGTPRYTK